MIGCPALKDFFKEKIYVFLIREMANSGCGGGIGRIAIIEFF